MAPDPSAAWLPAANVAFFSFTQAPLWKKTLNALNCSLVHFKNEDSVP